MMRLRRGEVESKKQREDKIEFLRQGNFVELLTDEYKALPAHYLLFLFLPQLNNGNTFEGDLIVKGKINL